MIKPFFCKKAAQAALLCAYCLFTPAPVWSQFQHFYGTGLNNHFTKVVPNSTGYYMLGGDESSVGALNRATVTRLDANGNHQWTLSMATPSNWTDAVLLPGGELMVVGHSLPFDASAKSIIGRVTQAGAFAWLKSYDHPGRDFFNRVVAQAGAYYVLAGELEPSGPFDNVALWNFTATGTLNWKKTYISSNDDEFVRDLVAIPSGGLLMAGNDTRGLIYSTDNNGDMTTTAVTIDNRVYRDVEANSSGGFYAAATNFPTGQGYLQKFDAGLLLLWEVRIMELTFISQVWEGSPGDLYVTGVGNFGGQQRTVIILLVDDPINGPSVSWVKYLHAGSSQTGGSAWYLPPNQLAFTDARVLPTGFGLTDANLSVSNLAMSNACEVTMTTATLLFTDPVPNGPQTYIAEPIPAPNPVNIIESSSLNWQQGVTCSPDLYAEVIGTVYRECSGLPYSLQQTLPGIRVQLWDLSGNLVQEVLSDSSGQYRLYDFPLGIYWCRVVQPLGWSPNVPASGEYLLDLTDSQQVVRDFGLCPTCSCESISLHAQPVPDPSATCAYVVQLSTGYEFCADYIDFKLETGSIAEAVLLSGDFILEILDSQLVRVFPGASGVWCSSVLGCTAFLRFGFELNGTDTVQLKVISEISAGGTDCTKSLLLPCPAPTSQADCCPMGMMKSGIELVQNGDFSTPSPLNIGPDYSLLITSSPTNWGQGCKYLRVNTNYLVANPLSGWSCLAKSGDPVNDYFLVFNGCHVSVNAPPQDFIAWRQPVTITPGSKYSFSVWANNLAFPTNNTYDPNIQIQIVENNSSIVAAANMVLKEVPDQWEFICLNWTAPPNAASNTYTLEILDLNSINVYGNDFALDCISFQECIPIPPCVCGTYSNMSFSPDPGTPNLPAACGDTLFAKCDGLNPWELKGDFQCAGTCPDTTQMYWMLTSPSGSMSSGSMIATPGFGITIPASAFNESGCYQLTLKAICGMDTCLCDFVVKVECDTCICQPSLTLSFGGQDYPVFCHLHVGPILSLSCPAKDVSVGGFMGCVDVTTGEPCDETEVLWELVGPDTVLGGGTTTNFTQFLFPADWVDAPGTYCLTLTTICKKSFCPPEQDTCVCKVTWIQEECPDSCCTTLDAFCERLENNVTLTVDNDSCKATLNVGNLPACDFIQWVDWGDGHQDPGPPSGGMVMHTYAGSGTYSICYLAIEVDTNGLFCFEKLVCDTIVVDCDSCFCGHFSHMFMRPGETLPGKPVFCDTTTVLIPCPKPGKSIQFTGKFQCAGTNCPPKTTVFWNLIRLPSTSVMSGSTPANPYFGINILPAWYGTPGHYELQLTAYCGSDTCTCIVRFTVDCPDPCPCDPTNFSNAVKKGFSSVSSGVNCKACFVPVALNDCDMVSWYIGNLNNPPLAMTTGSQPFCHQFNGSGFFTIIMVAMRKRIDGTVCASDSISRTFNIACIPILCTNPVLANPGFSQGAVSGVLGVSGASTGWSVATGQPRVVEGSAGSLDTWTISLSGNYEATDALMAKDSICMERDTGMMTIRARAESEARARPCDIMVVDFCPNWVLVDNRVSVPIPLSTFDSSDWMDIQIPFDLNDYVPLDSCGNPMQGVEVQPVIYVTNALGDAQGGADTRSVVEVDYFCFEGKLFTLVKVLKKGYDVRLYPNPNPGYFTLQLPNPAVQSMSIRVTDPMGRILLTQNAEPGNAFHLVQAAELPGSLYFLQVVLDGHILAVERFVKQ